MPGVPRAGGTPREAMWEEAHGGRVHTPRAAGCTRDAPRARLLPFLRGAERWRVLWQAYRQ